MKKFLICSLAVLLCAACVCAPTPQSRSEKNERKENANVVYVTDEGNGTFDADMPVERGLYTSLSLSINCGDGKVWATAKNDFTLFPSTVYVYVELYSSDTYIEDYGNMRLNARTSIPDLNMGNSITATYYTYGRQQYWVARMHYKIDNKAWEEKVTNPILVDGDGNLVR